MSPAPGDARIARARGAVSIDTAPSFSPSARRAAARPSRGADVLLEAFAVRGHRLEGVQVVKRFSRCIAPQPAVRADVDRRAPASRAQRRFELVVLVGRACRRPPRSSAQHPLHQVLLWSGSHTPPTCFKPPPSFCEDLGRRDRRHRRSQCRQGTRMPQPSGTLAGRTGSPAPRSPVTSGADVAAEDHHRRSPDRGADVVQPAFRQHRGARLRDHRRRRDASSVVTISSTPAGRASHRGRAARTSQFPRSVASRDELLPARLPQSLFGLAPGLMRGSIRIFPACARRTRFSSSVK
jgi:hypothetical protein